MACARWFFIFFLLIHKIYALTFDEEIERSTATDGINRPLHSSHVYPMDLSWKRLIDFTYEDRLTHQSMEHYGFDEILQTTQGVPGIYMQYGQHLTPYMPFTHPIIITDDDWKDNNVPDNLKRILKPFQNQAQKSSENRQAIQIAMYHEFWPLQDRQPRAHFAILHRNAEQFDGFLIDGESYGSYITTDYVAKFFDAQDISTFMDIVSFKPIFHLSTISDALSNLSATRLGSHLATLMASDHNYNATIIRNRVQTRLLPNLGSDRYILIEKLLRSTKELCSSQFLLGYLHLMGNIGDPNAASRYEIASEWLNKALRYGYVPAISQYAHLHDKHLVKRTKLYTNNESAFMWFNSLASQGYLVGKFYLACMHLNNQTTVVSSEKYNCAASLLRVGADLGDWAHQIGLACLYIDGHVGTINGAPDFVTGGKWLRVAALDGSATAQFNLGLLYTRCVFKPQPGAYSPYDGAVYWLRKAMAQNHVQAKYVLGLLYVNGRVGLKNGAPDIQYAYKLIQESAIEGYTNAIKWVDDHILDIERLEQRPTLWQRFYLNVYKIFHRRVGPTPAIV